MLTQVLLDFIGRGFEGGRLAFAAAGQRWAIGRGKPEAEIQLRDSGVLRRILIAPALRFGEAYMDHLWEPGDGGLARVLEIAVKLDDFFDQRERALARQTGLVQLIERNRPRISRRNVSHHYDLDASLYRCFLDTGMFYSCAYFARPDLSLEDAQLAKCELLARKLDLRPGAEVLDIGCGWGGLGIFLAQHYGVRVTGITLSEEQLAVARQRVRDAGLEGRVDFRLQDYRETAGAYDGIVSVGMFEHVGRPQYPTFFRKVHELLKPDGVAVLHTIGRLGPPGTTNPWVRKYIFPGGYSPAASEVTGGVEAGGLLLTDLEVWRLHYALTLAEWNRRFQSARGEFALRLGERFCRMWEFYLQASEAAFRWGNLCVFQIQMTCSPDRLPLTRNYLYPPEA